MSHCKLKLWHWTIISDICQWRLILYMDWSDVQIHVQYISLKTWHVGSRRQTEFSAWCICTAFRVLGHKILLKVKFKTPLFLTEIPKKITGECHFFAKWAVCESVDSFYCVLSKRQNNIRIRKWLDTAWRNTRTKTSINKNYQYHMLTIERWEMCRCGDRERKMAFL